MSKPTIKTIAQAAGVSTATVSKALNDMPDISEPVKARIRQIAHEMGYTINANARQLAKGHSSMIGLIMPDLTDEMAAHLYLSISQRVLQSGYTVFVSHSANNIQQEIECIRRMLQLRIAALIIMPVSKDAKHVEATVQDAIPVVYIGGNVPVAALYGVEYDDYTGGLLAARHFYRSGFRTSAVFTYGQAATPRHERMRGFVGYMQQHQCPVQVYNAGDMLNSEEAGQILVNKALANKNLPNAIFAADDLIALGAIAEFQQKGVYVPGHVSVIGYGNTAFAKLSIVKLTSISQPTNEMGICAADMAVELIEGAEDIVPRLRLEPQLVRRSSVFINN
ncbi:LacI family transcriptional regulator [Christensenellaceae bacterium OttesenSCG-928-M15]|nr:LacI family transcriptional regulator [Christensenellaceae bacterium OttesenSCG-928-M15]